MQRESARCEQRSRLSRTQDAAAQRRCRLVLNQKTPIDLLIEAASFNQAFPPTSAKTLPSPHGPGPSSCRTQQTPQSFRRPCPKRSAIPPVPASASRPISPSFATPAFGLTLKPEFRAWPATATSMSLRNNWWCKPWGQSQYSRRGKANAGSSRLGFMPADALSRAGSEYQQLQQLPDSVVVIGQRVLDYAKAHPDDSNIPEALALVVRAATTPARLIQDLTNPSTRPSAKPPSNSSTAATPSRRGPSKRPITIRFDRAFLPGPSNLIQSVKARSAALPIARSLVN